PLNVPALPSAPPIASPVAVGSGVFPSVTNQPLTRDREQLLLALYYLMASARVADMSRYLQKNITHISSALSETVALCAAVWIRIVVRMPWLCCSLTVIIRWRPSNSKTYPPQRLRILRSDRNGIANFAHTNWQRTAVS